MISAMGKEYDRRLACEQLFVVVGYQDYPAENVIAASSKSCLITFIRLDMILFYCICYDHERDFTGK